MFFTSFVESSDRFTCLVKSLPYKFINIEIPQNKRHWRELRTSCKEQTIEWRVSNKPSSKPGMLSITVTLIFHVLHKKQCIGFNSSSFQSLVLIWWIKSVDFTWKVWNKDEFGRWLLIAKHNVVQSLWGITIIIYLRWSNLYYLLLLLNFYISCLSDNV